MTNTIIVTKTATGYMAEYSGPHAGEIRELFGSTRIPTAYTACTPQAEVVAHLQQLNPGVTVTLGSCQTSPPCLRCNGRGHLGERHVICVGCCGSGKRNDSGPNRATLSGTTNRGCIALIAIGTALLPTC